MPFFKDKAMMEEMFGELWSRLVNETEFGAKLKENDISVLYRVTDPEVVMYIDEKGPVFREEAEAKSPVVTMSMTGDVVHRFWLKKINVPKALALREIRAKGPVGKLLQLMPLLKTGHEFYPEYCRKYDLPMDV